jgi:hypothetical protein
MKIVYEFCKPKWQYFWYVVMFVIFTYARAIVIPFVASPQYKEKSLSSPVPE